MENSPNTVVSDSVPNDDYGLDNAFGNDVASTAVMLLKEGLDLRRADVLSHKVNTWAGLDFATQSKHGYVAPVELDDFDWQIIKAAAPLANEQPCAC